MRKKHTQTNKLFFPSRWNYIKAWFFSRHVIKRMESVADEALTVTPESYYKKGEGYNGQVTISLETLSDYFMIHKREEIVPVLVGILGVKIEETVE